MKKISNWIIVGLFLFGFVCFGYILGMRHAIKKNHCVIKEELLNFPYERAVDND